MVYTHTCCPFTLTCKHLHNTHKAGCNICSHSLTHTYRNRTHTQVQNISVTQSECPKPCGSTCLECVWAPLYQSPIPPSSVSNTHSPHSVKIITLVKWRTLEYNVFIIEQHTLIGLAMPLSGALWNTHLIIFYLLQTPGMEWPYYDWQPLIGSFILRMI